MLATLTMPMDIISKSTNFLLDRFVWGRKPCLDVLPDDIIVDGIFDLLEVEDILCMRRVRVSLDIHPKLRSIALF